MTNTIEGWTHDYDNHSDGSEAYYDEAKDTSPNDWDIHPITTPDSDVDTIELPAERADLEDVEHATTLEDAIKAYDHRYTWDEINNGHLSPQFGAEMLLRINDKFNNQMTPDQRHGLAMETIAMGHAIGRLAERPAEAGGDRTSLKGLTELTDIISLAQIHAPQEVPSLEQALRDVAERIESRVSKEERVNPISGPILVALEEFDSLPPAEKEATLFTDIVHDIEHESLNRAEERVAKKHRILSRSPDITKSRPKVATQGMQNTMAATRAQTMIDDEIDMTLV